VYDAPVLLQLLEAALAESEIAHVDLGDVVA
jgi:hypothetical protein